MKACFRAGKPILKLAEVQGRTRAAIEAELARQGMSASRYKTGA